MTLRRWNRLVCRIRGHIWVVAEITGYRPDGRTYIRPHWVRLCVRCTARG